MMLNIDTESSGLLREFKIEIAIPRLYGLTLTLREMHLLGLKNEHLFPVLREVSNLDDFSVNLKDVVDGKVPTKLKRNFKIRRAEILPMARRLEINKKGVDRPLTRAIIISKCDFVDQDFLDKHEIGFSYFLQLVKSYLVLDKIKFSKEDLETMEVENKLIKINNPITLTLHRATSAQDFVRSRRCPVKHRCHLLFVKTQNRIFDCYSCSNCVIAKQEKKLQLMGYFEEVDCGSYGVVTSYRF